MHLSRCSNDRDSEPEEKAGVKKLGQRTINHRGPVFRFALRQRSMTEWIKLVSASSSER